jgi:transposase
MTVAIPGDSVRHAAKVWGVSKSTAARWIAAGRAPAGQTSSVA